MPLIVNFSDNYPRKIFKKGVAAIRAETIELTMRQVELRQYPNMYQIWRRAETIPICTRYGVGVEFSHIHSIPHNFIKKFSYFIIKGKGGEFNSPLRHAGKKLSFKNAKHPAKWR